MDMHDKGEEVIRLDGDALKAFIPIRHGIKRESHNRSVNTQFSRRVLHVSDVMLPDELGVVVGVSSGLISTPIGISIYSMLKS